MEKIPSTPLLTPRSDPSSPCSSFSLNQSIDADKKQSDKASKLKDVPSQSGLDDGDDERANVAVDEERPQEKSHWSDDSDVDEDEDIEDQLDNEDNSGERETPRTTIGAKDKAADEETFKVEGKEDMDAAVVPEKTDDEMAELNGTAYAGHARRLNGISGRPASKPSIHDDVRE